MGESAFEGCEALSRLIIGTNLASIAKRTFYRCKSLVDIVIGPKVLSIGVEAFAACSALKTIALPDACISVATGTFTNCSSLTIISLGKNFNTFGRSDYEDLVCVGCDKLVEVGVNEENTKYTSIAGVLFTKDAKTLVFFPPGKSGAYAIPRGTDVIARYAFAYANALTSVTSDQLLSIKNYAFFNCDKLATVTVVFGPINIYQYAFHECNALTDVVIGKEVELVEARAFHCRGLKNINVTGHGHFYTSINGVLASRRNGLVRYPPGRRGDYIIHIKIRTIESYAFEFANVTKLTFGMFVKYIRKNAFTGVLGLGSLSLPNSLVSIESEAFKSCWGLKSVDFGRSVENIGASAFENCTNITSISLSNNLHFIKAKAFKNCERLQKVSLPSAVWKIEDEAFMNNVNLSSLSLNKALSKIGFDAFRNCSVLKSVTLYDNITYLGDRSFMDCVSLKSVDLGASSMGGCWYQFSKTCQNDCVTRNIIPFGKINENDYGIGNYAFANCISLKKLEVVSNCSEAGIYSRIGIGAFFNCSALEKVKILNVSIIDRSAFERCTNLTSVTLGKNVTRIGERAFALCKSLKSIVIPDTVKLTNDAVKGGVRADAFFNCSNLTNVIYLGESNPAQMIVSGPSNPVVTVRVFDECPKLQHICVDIQPSTNTPETYRGYSGNEFAEIKGLYDYLYCNYSASSRAVLSFAALMGVVVAVLAGRF